MAEFDLTSRVRYARSGGSIERCHQRPHLLRYSVGHHTFDMMTLLTICWRAGHGGQLPSANLLIAAMAHDIGGEPITGDINSPIKAMLGAKLEAVDQRGEEFLGFDVPLTEEEALYLRAADKVECYLWVVDETLRGNTTFYDWKQEMDDSWSTNPWPRPFMEIIREYEHLRTHPSNSELHRIGGLI